MKTVLALIFSASDLAEWDWHSEWPGWHEWHHEWHEWPCWQPQAPVPASGMAMADPAHTSTSARAVVACRAPARGGAGRDPPTTSATAGDTTQEPAPYSGRAAATATP